MTVPVPSLQTLLVENLPSVVLLRDRSWPSEYGHEAWNWSPSMALICPRCLRQWAILAFEGDEELLPQGAHCEAHGSGTLILPVGPVDEPLLAALPEALLRREFELTLKELGV